MEKISRMHLFQGYGIELEYMIVDKDTLDVKPIADELLKLKAGEYVDEIENGSISWSNELVLHVIELKCTVPTKNLWQLNADFAANIKEINQLLDRFNAKLMPTAAHPWMNPENDTFLWPHGNSEVYETYNQIFNCKGHGWSNLQSTHINLPFYDDEEFAALHMAVRLILPIIPGIAASSPILDGNFTGFHDKRMVYYGENQKRIPSITGKIIPERVNSKRQYHKLIYEPIKANIEPYNANNQLKPVWVNSRGAIARFDRGSLEIRIMDIQECPLADLAIVTLIIHVVKLLVKEQLSSYKTQQNWEVQPLHTILMGTIQYGHNYQITNKNYLHQLGVKEDVCTTNQLWKELLLRTLQFYPEEMAPWASSLNEIIKKGTLASRILEVANGVYAKENLQLIYQEIGENLASNQLFNSCDPTLS